jgi:hypothetical protein
MSRPAGTSSAGGREHRRFTTSLSRRRPRSLFACRSPDEAFEPSDEAVDVVAPRGIAQLDALTTRKRFQALRQLLRIRKRGSSHRDGYDGDVVRQRALELEPDEIARILEPPPASQFRIACSIVSAKSVPIRIVSTSMNTFSLPKCSARAS